MPIRFSLNSQNLPEFLLRVVFHLIMLALFGYAFVGFARILSSGSPIAAIGEFCFIFAAIALGAIIFASLYVQRFSDKFIDALFGGKHYLAKAPRTYGMVTGLIAEQKISEAVVAINDLLTDPDSRRDPRLARIILELYADNLHQPEVAWEYGVSFFTQSPAPDVQPEENLRALLLLDDLGTELGKHDEARAILTAALQSRLPGHDRKALKRRLEAK